MAMESVLSWFTAVPRALTINVHRVFTIQPAVLLSSYWHSIT